MASSTTALGFDTATADSTVAVTRDGDCIVELLATTPADRRPRHAETLLAEIERAAERAGGWERIDMLAVGTGPGSFTGLRIGVVTARALAQGLGKPLAGVGSLDALARGIGEHPAAEGRHRLAVIDAKRSEVFTSLYGPDGALEWGPIVVAPAALAERLGSSPLAPLAAGDGAVRFRRDLEVAGSEVPAEGDAAHRLSARHICSLAEDGQRSAPPEIEPTYLRPPDAKAWRERDRGRTERG